MACGRKLSRQSHVCTAGVWRWSLAAIRGTPIGRIRGAVRVGRKLGIVRCVHWLRAIRAVWDRWLSAVGGICRLEAVCGNAQCGKDAVLSVCHHPFPESEHAAPYDDDDEEHDARGDAKDDGGVEAGSGARLG